MKKHKKQAERMPRKMKKRFKSLMAFFDERRTEFFVLTTLTKLFNAKDAVLAKCSTLGISPADIEKIDYNDKLQTATVTLKGAMRTATISIVVEEGTNNADNN